MRTESESKRPIPENFAQTSEISAFNFQHELCKSFVNSLKTRLQLSTELPMGHLLVSGPNFGGKSTLMQLIANSLFDEMRIFASRIDCNEFKGTHFNTRFATRFKQSLSGKSPDTVGNLLDVRLKILKIRTPALLLLDNLDFLNSQVEDEDRRRFISKVYTSVFFTYLVNVCLLI